LALCYCLNGERELMREQLLAANAYAAYAALEPGPIRGVQWLAEFSDALHRGDAAEATAVARKFSAFGRGAVSGDLMAAMLSAAAQLADGDPAVAAGELTRIVASPRFSRQNPVTRGFALAYAAHAGLRAGRPGAVLDLIGPVSSPASHPIC